MRSPYEINRGRANLITGVVMVLVYLLVNLLFPGLGTRLKLLIALIAGCAASVAIYYVNKRKREKEEEEKLPPV